VNLLCLLQRYPVGWITRQPPKKNYQLFIFPAKKERKKERQKTCSYHDEINLKITRARYSFLAWYTLCSENLTVLEKSVEPFLVVPIFFVFLVIPGFSGVQGFIPKLLLRLLWFFRRTAALFRQIFTFAQLFRFYSDLGNSGIRQFVRNSMLTGC